MKKSYYFYSVFSALVVLMFIFASCTKEGPAGPAGANGTDGTNGSDGTNGVDGNVSCLVCHTAVNMDEIAATLDTHKHVTGSSWGRGTSASCGMCHSSDGFIEFARSGEAVGAAVSTHLTCVTCHSNHGSLEDGIDAPMRYLGPVQSIAVEGHVYDHGAGNLCATCHQARRASSGIDNQTEHKTYSRTFTGDDIAVYQAHGAIGPAGTMELMNDTLFVTFDVPTTYVYTNSTHAGPHHGPQSNIFAADIGTVAGTPFTRDHHTDCVSCHVATELPGAGHGFAPDVAKCNECHGDAFNMFAEQEGIIIRLAAVGAALEAIGAIHIAEDGVHPMYASLERAKWNAFWNYMCLVEDKSAGLHNFGYAKQLLTAAESALGL